MHDPIDFTIHIACPAEILAWIICVLFTGTAMTIMLKHQASKFATDLAGKRISLQQLHRTSSKEIMQSRLLQLPATAQNSLTKQLRIDFFFMPFLYLMMCSFSLLILHITCDCSVWLRVLNFLCWLPFLIWVFDLLENLLLKTVIRQYSSEQGLQALPLMLMTVANFLKWTLAATWVVVHLSHGIAWLVTRNFLNQLPG